MKLQVVLAALLLLVVGCNEADSIQAFNQVNSTRVTNSTPALFADSELIEKAQIWADHLADTCVLEHSSLRQGVTQKRHKLAENVGSGGSLEAIHKAFEASRTHFLQIIDPAFTKLGVGVSVGDCSGSPTVFVVHEFLG